VHGGAPDPPPASEACPLCGAPLAPSQDWCLRCGAAARTRLAASPRWRGAVVTVVVIAALALGVLAAALVKLAGESSSSGKPLGAGSPAVPSVRVGTVSQTVPSATAPAATAPVATAPAATAPAATTPATTAPPSGVAGGATAPATGGASGTTAAPTSPGARAPATAAPGG
jgi:hypothetical protein